MKLDSMVGDIEDAVSSAINKNLRKQSLEVRTSPNFCVIDGMETPLLAGLQDALAKY